MKKRNIFLVGLLFSGFLYAQPPIVFVRQETPSIAQIRENLRPLLGEKAISTAVLQLKPSSPPVDGLTPKEYLLTHQEEILTLLSEDAWQQSLELFEKLWPLFYEANTRFNTPDDSRLISAHIRASLVCHHIVFETAPRKAAIEFAETITKDSCLSWSDRLLMYAKAKKKEVSAAMNYVSPAARAGGYTDSSVVERERTAARNWAWKKSIACSRDDAFMKSNGRYNMFRELERRVPNAGIAPSFQEFAEAKAKLDFESFSEVESEIQRKTAKTVSAWVHSMIQLDEANGDLEKLASESFILTQMAVIARLSQLDADPRSNRAFTGNPRIISPIGLLPSWVSAAKWQVYRGFTRKFLDFKAEPMRFAD